MQNILDFKVLPCLPPTSKDNDDFDGLVPVDTQGLSELAFLIQTGSMAAAVGSEDDASPLKIVESDELEGEYTDVEDAEMAAAIAAVNENKNFIIRVNLRRTHKRYMKPLDPHAGDGTMTDSYLAIVALGLPDVSRSDADGVGVEELVLA